MKTKSIDLAISNLARIETEVMQESRFQDACAARIQCVVMLACTEELVDALHALQSIEITKP
jgi:hypothetical protein